MARKFNKAAFFLTTALSLGAAAPDLAQAAAAAQPAPPQDEQSVDTIIVTARRVEERLQDVPISMTVLNPTQLANRNIVSVADLAIYVPSLSSTPRFGPDNATFAIRGFVQDAFTAPSVAVYFADVAAQRVNAATAAGNGAGPGSFFDLQNVQVLKGPQGTLFGRNTTGGAVLLVPNKPGREFEGYVEGSVGNYDMRRLQAVLNVPVKDRARVRLGLDRQVRDGYLKNRSGIGPKDFNDVDYWAGRLSLVLDVTPDLENYTIASLTNSDINGYVSKIELCNPTATGIPQGILGPRACQQIARQNARGDGFWDVENDNAIAHQRVRQRQVINTTTWRVSDTTTIKNIASYGTFRQSQASNIFGTNFEFSPGVPLTYTSIYPLPGHDLASQWTFTEELQFQGRTPNDRVIWQAGLYLEKSGPLDGFQATLGPALLSCTDPVAFQCFDPIGRSLGGRAVGSINVNYNKYWFNNKAMYGQATYKLTDQLNLTGGLRFTDDSVRSKGRSVRYTFPAPNTPVGVCSVFPTVRATDPALCEREVNQDSARPTWLVDLDYKPHQDVLLYGKYARGYRQGGVNTSNVGFGQTWGPEKVDTYEVGAKTSWRGAIPGNFNIAAFYNDFRDQQILAVGVAIPPGQQAAGLVNAGKSRIRGVEIEASVNPLTGLTFDLSYAYLDTKLQEFAPPAFDPTRFTQVISTSQVGGPLTYAPKNRVSLTGTYRLPLAESIGRVALGATYTHTAEQLASASSPIGVLPATDLLNLNLNWTEITGRPVDISVFATNVTNEKYFAAVSGSFASAGFEPASLAQPRMYGVRVRYRFGE
jgi:iron complex outermembrane receptor protein